MFFFYQIIILIIIILSPIILIIRFLKNKEHARRFVEKFCIINNKKSKGNLIWIHAASVGEFMSVVPLINELEKIAMFNKSRATITIDQILKLTNLRQNFDISELVDSTLSKEKKKLLF